jgi:hypothetical protein
VDNAVFIRPSSIGQLGTTDSQLGTTDRVIALRRSEARDAGDDAGTPTAHLTSENLQLSTIHRPYYHLHLFLPIKNNTAKDRQQS